MSAPPSSPPVAAASPFVYGLSKTLLRIAATVWLRLRLEGRRHVPPTGPVLLVGNHASYLDPPLLGFVSRRRVSFLAKQGLARWGPLRWWLAAVGVSLIDRAAPSKDVLRRLAQTLEHGGCVALFPEGTRSADGSVGPFRTGIEFLVRRTGAVVVPVGIEGSFRAFPRGAKWPRPTKCCVRAGPARPAAAVLAPGGVEQLRAEVAALARAPLRATAAGSPAPQVGHGPGASPADPSPSARSGA